MRGVRTRLPGLLLGSLFVLGAMAGAFAAARQAETEARSRTDAALARNASLFLSVVVPAGPANGYDPARLLAAVNTLARASFWPGGFQLALGSVPLLPDTIGLLPLPDSLWRRLDQGDSVVVARHAARPVALVPFLDRDRYGMLGWAAAWDLVPARVPSGSSKLAAVIVLVTLGVIAVALLLGRARVFPPLAVALAGAMMLLALDLHRSVGRTLADGAELRVLTLKRLIEVAATAPGVRQALLPEIAVGVQVREHEGSAADTPTGTRTDPSTGEVVAVAATPRTGGGLELALAPERERLGRFDRWLALCLAGGLAGLTLLALTVRYCSSSPDVTSPDTA